ncbi:MAG: Phenylacetic acid catabolic protein, partial [Candidatus Limnocylindrales bacterium]
AQQALRESSYGPYSRTMKKICWEESVHIMHGRDVVVTMMNGSQMQRDMVQEALDRWWGPLMQMHGPRTDPAKDRDLYWRIKEKTGEQLRQEFLSTYVPRLWGIGLFPPDADLKLDEATGEWRYSEPDWQELRTVVTNHGPKSQERLDFRRMNHDDTAWVRQTILAAPAAAA